MTQESNVTHALASDLEAPKVTLTELHIDRGYLNSHFVQEGDENLTIICKAWSEGKYFEKTAFVLNWEDKLISCPNGVSIPFDEGKRVQFKSDKCKICP